MKWKLRFTVEARADLRSVADYLQAEAGPRAAARYTRDLRRRIAHLREMPKAGALIPNCGPGVRFVPCGRQVIYYEMEERHIVIMRVLHAAQDRDAIMGRSENE